MEIFYWSDIACPFCYIGSVRMKRAMAELGLDPENLEMKAYQLNPYAPQETDETMLTQFAASHGMSQEQAKQQLSQIEAMAAEEKLSMDTANAVPTNTMAAHRLIKWTQDKKDKAAVSQLINRLYKVYFEDGRSIADYEVLLNAVAETGLPTKEVQAVLNSNDYEKAVMADILQAQQSGVQGAPFFVINQQYAVSGAQPFDYLLAALKHIQTEEKQ
ncbi:DsbA family oxidoreductase [Streptococcus pantholopis]|uniref:Protein-disulfide isomerase n=1 Tax=Streptococcus pantholopis TaxID=1811193 RepID=A0A172Q7R9_9STRE|nr:DsbA family oxidoreductase [Streptococcus pantholopis]AND79498.1 protein-disulfide isomerase [Streptococcus pantholopis]